MTRISLLALTICLAFQPVAQAEKTASIGSMITAMRDYENKKDDLAIRILVKRVAHAVPTYGDWIRVRQLLMRRPSVGYGLLYAWDRLPYRGKRTTAILKDEDKVNRWIDGADERMSAGHFQEAFTAYQAAAKMLKNQIIKGHRENKLLYEYTVQSMARALYGAGRFDDSLNVYGWIGRNYPRYRQVLFEKMWAAFRGNHADVALGAIASQRSTYFADYMEPESYLVQLYIYKKLCREDEIKTLRYDITRFRKALQSGTFTYSDWAKSDLELYGLLHLTEEPVQETEGPVTTDDKKKEQQKILGALKAKFEKERRRISKELDQVLAYSYLAVGTKILTLAGSDLDSERLRKDGMEVWPVNDAEDWLDELGSHLYIGTSQCAKQ